jgi:protein-serine/threonine kinase
LLDRNPETRIGSTADDSFAIRNHPFFSDMDWQALIETKIDSPYKPEIR